MFLGGAKRRVEKDFKKIIAFSTLRQASLMVFVGSLNLRYLIFFHIIAHARIKFLLFLVFGELISAGFGRQEARRVKFGCLIRSKFFGRVCLFGLLGLFFLSRSISKEIILGLSFLGCWRRGFFMLFFISNLFTLFYSFSLLRIINKRGHYRGVFVLDFLGESLSLFLLFFLSTFFGLFFLSCFFYAVGLGLVLQIWVFFWVF